MKKRILGLIVIVLVVVSIAGYKKVNNIIRHPFTVSSDLVEIKVNNGDTLYSLFNSLNNKKIIGNTLIIKWYVKNYNLSTNIKPGTYTLKSSITLDSLILSLNTGKYNENAMRITIPEGYDIDRIASLFQEKGLISKERFIKSIQDYVIPDYIKKDNKRKYSLEGFLFPDTYEFTKTMSGKEIIDIMLKRFESVFNEIKKKSSLSSGSIDMDKITVMASIIEWEAEVRSERSIVASVFYNRLKIGMKLQSCATVQYSLGQHKSKLSIADTKVNSPYNTYMVEGLPIGPICSPGKESLEAAIKPETTNYIYFVSKNDGTHFFTNDYNQFLQKSKETQGN